MTLLRNHRRTERPNDNVSSFEPDRERHEEYKFYVDKYAETYPQMKDLMHEVSHHVAGQERS
jgi:sugar (pentulose or hexulose) kinase